MKLTCLALIRGYINIRPHTKTTCRQTMAFILSHSALPPVPYGHFGGGQHGDLFCLQFFFFFHSLYTKEMLHSTTVMFPVLNLTVKKRLGLNPAWLRYTVGLAQSGCGDCCLEISCLPDPSHGF